MFPDSLKKKQKTLDKRKNILKRNTTLSELQIRKLLIQLKPKLGRVIFQKGFIAGNGYCICDFYNPKYGICIEVDGGYHFTPEQQRKDWYKNKYLTQERKMRVFRIRNEETENLSADELYEMLMKIPRKSVAYSPNYHQ